MRFGWFGVPRAALGAAGGEEVSHGKGQGHAKGKSATEDYLGSWRHAGHSTYWAVWSRAWHQGGCDASGKAAGGRLPIVTATCRLERAFCRSSEYGACDEQSYCGFVVAGRGGAAERVYRGSPRRRRRMVLLSPVSLQVTLAGVSGCTPSQTARTLAGQSAALACKRCLSRQSRDYPSRVILV